MIRSLIRFAPTPVCPPRLQKELLTILLATFTVEVAGTDVCTVVRLESPHSNSWLARERAFVSGKASFATRGGIEHGVVCGLVRRSEGGIGVMSERASERATNETPPPAS